MAYPSNQNNPLAAIPSYPVPILGTPCGYVQQLAYAANAITAASWAATAGGQVTFTTTSGHGVTVGASFVISGMTPAGYNGTYIAITGTTGSTLVASKVVDPGAATVMGTLGASLATASGLIYPAGSTVAYISVGGAGIRYRDDGVDPTATVGFPAAVGQALSYAGDLSLLRIIQQGAGAFLDIVYYK